MAISDPPVAVTKIRSASLASISGSIADMAANNLMACIISTYNGDGVNHTASDSENGSYSTMLGKKGVGGSSQCGLSVHYFQNTVAGAASSGNVVGGSSVQAITAVFYEVSGLSTSAAFTAGEVSGSSGTSTAPDSGQVTNSVANSILLSGMTNFDGSAVVQYTINQSGSVGTWKENTSSGRELAGNTFQDLGTAWQVVSAASSQRHVWQSSNQAWVTIIAAFGAAAGGAAARPTPLRSLMGVGF